MSPRRHRSATRRVDRFLQGFSLTELIVSLGIVTIIAALIIPSMSKSRDAAIATKCAANQRVLITSLLNYAQDNDLTFPVSAPGGSRWFYRISSYVPGFEDTSVRNPDGKLKPSYAKIVICPIPEHAGWNEASGTYGLHEGFGSYDSGGAGDYPAVRINKVSRPSRLPVLCCEGPLKGGHKMTTNGPNPYAAEKYGYVGPTRDYGPGPNHRGKCNFAFLDGHIELQDVTRRNQWPWNDPKVFSLE